MRTGGSPYDCLLGFTADPSLGFTFSFSSSSFPISPFPLQRPVLLRDGGHAGVSAVLADPSHGHAGVHPGVGRGEQRTQGAGLLRGRRPAAEPDRRSRWTHRQSLPVSPPVCVCVCVQRGDTDSKRRGRCGGGQRTRKEVSSV